MSSSRDRWDLLPWSELRDIVGVLVFGAKKPGRSDFGWQKRSREEHVQAARGHFDEYMSGKRIDDETKLPTIAHVIARLLFVAWHDNNSSKEP